MPGGGITTRSHADVQPRCAAPGGWTPKLTPGTWRWTWGGSLRRETPELGGPRTLVSTCSARTKINLYSLEIAQPATVTVTEDNRGLHRLLSREGVLQLSRGPAGKRRVPEVFLSGDCTPLLVCLTGKGTCPRSLSKPLHRLQEAHSSEQRDLFHGLTAVHSWDIRSPSRTTTKNQDGGEGVREQASDTEREVPGTQRAESSCLKRPRCLEPSGKDHTFSATCTHI